MHAEGGGQEQGAAKEDAYGFTDTWRSPRLRSTSRWEGPEIVESLKV